MGYFYPRSPCGERQESAAEEVEVYEISIHALLAESDNRDIAHRKRQKNISIHALLAESDPGKVKLVEPGLVFLSTLSLRRATLKPPVKSHAKEHFYPRSPCGERPPMCTINRMPLIISIHALLAESDPKGSVHDFKLEEFLSTLSLRRATCSSILSQQRIEYFYPRSPCGERLRNAEAVSKYMIFLSTLSLRRATLRALYTILSLKNFYPRSPCGERPGTLDPKKYDRTFLSTLSLRRATLKQFVIGDVMGISIHALLAESD